MTNTEYVLWGFKGPASAFPMPFKLTGGPLAYCRAQRRMRKGEGWTFGIYKEGVAPEGLRLQALAAEGKTPAR